jgi:hypothetical protein
MVLRVDTELLRDRKSGAVVKGNRASEIGHECMTWHLLKRLRSDLAKPKNLGMKKRFHIGTALERPNMRLLQDAGLDVMESQEPLDWATGNLSGHMDARIGLPKIGPGDFPLEGKTAAPSTYRMIKKIYDTSRDWHDLLAHKFTYLRAYPAQLQAYELLYNKEWGCWFFFEKASGDYFFWIVPLDYEYAETLVKRAEAIEALVKSGTIPAANRCDECAGCDYADTYCFVGKDLGPGYDLLLSAEEIAMWEPRIERALELKPFSQEHDDLMEEIKEAFKGRITLIGKYLVRSKAYSTTSYKVPKEIKAPYAVAIEGFRLTIETL